MSKPQITAHMVVKNEDRFIWYSISSVLPFVDEFLITDTGSSDDTVEVIKSFVSPKIKFVRKIINDPLGVGNIRDMQIKETKTDWFWIVDGDEVYSQNLCREIKEILEVRGQNLEGVVVKRYDLLGDIYHYQDETVGAYDLFGKKGHLVVRLLNKSKIEGLAAKGKYPYEGYYDSEGMEIIHHDKNLFYISSGKLFHAMYLTRSSLGSNLTNTFHRKKWKLESGFEIKDKSLFPKVFFEKKPSGIYDVTQKRGKVYEIMASMITPVKKIKKIFDHKL